VVDLKQIRAFAHIAELRSFTRAAAFLHISQPALSRQMRLLEEELKMKLFQRQTHGVELTNEGLAFFNRCREVLTNFEQLRQDFSPAQGTRLSVMGSVSVGLPVPASRFATPRLLAAARDAYPGLSVRFVEGFSGLLHEWLISGSLDIAILFEPRTSKILTSKALLMENLFAICKPDNAFGGQAFIEAKDLGTMPLILPHRPHILRELVDSLHLNHVEVVEIDSASLMIELAASGIGITILPRESVSHAVRAGDVIALPILNPTLSWQVTVCYSNVRPLSLGARVVLDLLRKDISHRVTSGEWPHGRLMRMENDEFFEETPPE
jgi:LysR family nitrogen assimilation transcriptional regulator